MDKVSRGPRDNGTNGQMVISSTQGQGLLKKSGQFELVSEEGPSCFMFRSQMSMASEAKKQAEDNISWDKTPK